MGAGHETGGIRRKEQRRFGNVARLARAADRIGHAAAFGHHAGHLLRALCIEAERAAEDAGRDEARDNRVDAYAVRRQLGRRQPCVVQHAGLRHRIGDRRIPRLQGRDRRGVDDRPAAAALHVGCGKRRASGNRTQQQRLGQVPSVGIPVFDAMGCADAPGIAEQDVEPAEMQRRQVERRLDLLRRRDVAVNKTHCAGVLLLERAPGILLHIGGDHARALLHKQGQCGQADARCSAGDDSDFSVESVCHGMVRFGGGGVGGGVAVRQRPMRWR